MKEKLSERELSIRNLFWAVCLKWKQFLIAALIGVILLGGFSYYRSLKEVKAKKQLKEEPVKIEELSLEEDAITESLNVYLEYYQKYMAQLRYNREACLMKLDPNCFYKGEVTYYVDNHYQVEYPVMEKKDNTYGIASEYLANLTSLDLTKEIAEIEGVDDVNIAYASELIDITNRFGYRNTITTDLEQGIFTVSVYSSDYEKCQKLLELVTARIEEYQKTAISKYGKHDLIQLAQKCVMTSDPYLLTVQTEQVDRQRNYYWKVDEFEKELTEDELTFAEAYRTQYELEHQPEEPEFELAEPKAKVSKKWLLLGFVAGVAVLFMIYVLKYIFNAAIRLEDELDAIYKVPVLGVILEKLPSFKGLSGFFKKKLYEKRRFFEKDNAVEMAAANVRVLGQKNNINQIYVTGTVSDDVEGAVIGQIADTVKEYGITMEYGKSILYDAASLENAAKTGTVVIACTPGVTTYREIAEMMDLCKEQGSEVLGILVIGK